MQRARPVPVVGADPAGSEPAADPGSGPARQPEPDRAGVLLCALASVAIASLAVGLRIRLWAQWLVAARLLADHRGRSLLRRVRRPVQEPGALVGLMLVAAGVVYLGRGWRLTVFGLVLAGAGGFLAILSKEQYLVLAAPICLTLVLATARPRLLARAAPVPGPAGHRGDPGRRGPGPAGRRLRTLGLHQLLRPAAAPHPGRGHALHGHRDQARHRARPAPGARPPRQLGQVRGPLLLGQDVGPAEPALRAVHRQADRQQHHPLPAGPSGQHPERRPVGRDRGPAVPDHQPGRLPRVRRAIGRARTSRGSSS